MKRNWNLRAALLAALMLFMLCPAVLANTDGSEPKLTLKPDRLILQLGPQWAGAEFELRTDAGIFPAPVKADQFGVLTMDLGGSTTYMLSCIPSSVPVLTPTPEPPYVEPVLPVDLLEPEKPEEPEKPASIPEPVPPEEPKEPEEPPEAPSEPPQKPEPEPETPKRNSLTPVVVFLVLLLAALGGLFAVYHFKTRKQSSYEDWEDEDEEQ